MKLRLRTCVMLVVAELAYLGAMAAMPTPAAAQWGGFGDFFGGQRGGRRYQQQWNPFFGQPQRARPRQQARPAQGSGDYANAPPAAPKPEKEATAEAKTVVVLGDSMADWLASGLDQTFAENPDMTVVRKHRAYSSLINNPGRANAVDWPALARETLANQPANFIVMMIGLADREPIRVAAVPPRPAVPAVKPGAKPGQPGQPGQSDAAAPPADQTKPPDGTDAADAPDAPQPGTPAATYEFKSDKWAELYGKRIDETMAALKSKGVPVFWVGLPPLLGARSTADMQYLNDLYRRHAEKNGITYIDVWDGFVDEAGRFAMQGPDYEGQIRRLRTPDGVYFTPSGARKLAHYVEREIQRALTPTGPIAVPLPQEPLLDAPVAAQQPGSNGTPRPLAGPVIPLNASIDASKSDQLAGGAAPRQTITDAVATRVLVKGEPMPAPAGRADDYAWPRRAPAPVGADPVVATTTLPMTPMVASTGGTQKEATVAAGPPAPPKVRTAQQQAPARPRNQYGYNPYGRQQQSPFFFFFGR